MASLPAKVLTLEPFLSMRQVCGPRGTHRNKPEWHGQSGNDDQHAALAVSGVDPTGLFQ